MAEYTFTKPEDLNDLYGKLVQIHDKRIAKQLRLQSLWEMPVRSTETGRTVFVNNEPWTATRLTVALVNQGKLIFRGSAPPSDNPDKNAKNNAAISQVERLLKAHFRQTDFNLFQRRRGTFLRQLAYHMAVHGWHAGITVVQDNKQNGEWPIFTDVWSPLDTLPDMESTAIVHRSRIRWGQLKSTFTKEMGMSFTPPDGTKDQDAFDVLDYYDSETNGAVLIDGIGGAPHWLKQQKEHGFNANPAWCNPVDAVPFRPSALLQTGRQLKVSTSPDAEDNRWLEYVGQSPILGYETAYRYMSELANQIADVVERWASGLLLVKTIDGKWADMDPAASQGQPHFMDRTSIVEVVKPPTFPVDDRAWMAVVAEDISRASYPREAYGSVGAGSTPSSLQLMRAASQYIIEPIVEQAEDVSEYCANNILRQLESGGRKKQYKKFIAVRSIGKQGGGIQDWIKLSDVPDGIYVSASLKGSGIPSDRLQTLLAITNVANSANPPVSIETLLDEFLELEDPPGEIARMFWQKMTSSKMVEEKAAPILTLTEWADKIRLKGTDKANAIADAFNAMAYAGMMELRANVMQSINSSVQAMAQPVGAPPPVEPAVDPTGGAGSVGAIAGAGMDPNMQQAGVAPVGAPPAGSTMPTTGPRQDIAAAMQGPESQLPSRGQY